MTGYILLIVFLLWASLLANLLFYVGLRRQKGQRGDKVAINAALLVFSIVFALLLAEAYFYFFVSQSDGFGFTLSSRRWKEKYWSPINSMGYRDSEHSPDSLKGKKTVFVVGDSFVAGHGIKHREDRFSDILGAKLGDGWSVVVIARNGWSTYDELNALLAYPYNSPDVIILSYYPNDIEGAARINGIMRPKLFSDISPLEHWFVERSHLLNYLYWRVYRKTSIEKNGMVYWNYIKDCFSNEAVWRTHAEELSDIVKFSNQNNSKLIVLLFPDFAEFNTSRRLNSRVGALMKRQGAEVIDLSAILEGRDFSRLVVSPLDTHPNERLNMEVAQLLYNAVTAR